MKKIITSFLLFFSTATFSQSLATYNWTPLPFHGGYIDLSRLDGDKVSGFKVVTLLSFDQISSAQMWGLSDVSELKIDCSRGTFQYLKTSWTEKKMARGAVTKVFNAPQKNPVSIRDVMDGTFERDLFKYICK